MAQLRSLVRTSLSREFARAGGLYVTQSKMSTRPEQADWRRSYS